MSRPDATSDTPPSWRLLRTGAHTGAWNMACDEALCESVRAGAPPVVRFYEWEPAALSFGYSQQVEREVVISRVEQAGVGLVRRVTGGRGVFHADEMTYSVICRQDDPVAAGGITETYTRISRGLTAGLRSLGIDAELTRHVDPTAPVRAPEATLPCFGSTARAEIVIAGRKLVGSAQHRMKDLMLQHGSIPTGPRHKDIVGFLRAEERTIARFRQVLDASTISLSEAGWTGTTASLAEALAEGLAAELGIVFKNTGLTSGELARTEDLTQSKYETDSWNFSDRAPSREGG